MSAASQRTLVILAKGLGTRMDAPAPKTLIALRSGQTILGRILDEAVESAAVDRIILLIRQDSRALRTIIRSCPIPTEVHIEEPQGYFLDLLDAKRRFMLKTFWVIDSDLVAPSGEIAEFLRHTDAATTAWLTIGVTTTPEEESGRPAWVTMTAQGDVVAMSRTQQATYRMVGIYHWGAAALQDIIPADMDKTTSITAYIADHVRSGCSVGGLPFSQPINVNTKEDVYTANTALGLI